MAAKGILSLAGLSNDMKALIKEINTLNKNLDTFIEVSKTIKELTAEMKLMNENMTGLIALFGELKGS